MKNDTPPLCFVEVWPLQFQKAHVTTVLPVVLQLLPLGNSTYSSVQYCSPR